MIHNMEYTGIPLRTLLNEAGVKTEGKWVFVEGADASSNGRSIPMDKALDDVLVAFKANGEALRKEHGYPVRLVVPGWEGTCGSNGCAVLRSQKAPLTAAKKHQNTQIRWKTEHHAATHGRWMRNLL